MFHILTHIPSFRAQVSLFHFSKIPFFSEEEKIPTTEQHQKILLSVIYLDYFR